MQIRLALRAKRPRRAQASLSPLPPTRTCRSPRTRTSAWISSCRRREGANGRLHPAGRTRARKSGRKWTLNFPFGLNVLCRLPTSLSKPLFIQLRRETTLVRPGKGGKIASTFLSLH